MKRKSKLLLRFDNFHFALFIMIFVLNWALSIMTPSISRLLLLLDMHQKQSASVQESSLKLKGVSVC